MRSLKTGALVALILFILVVVESLLLMLASGRLFNSLTVPIIDNLDFLWLLIKSSPWQGLLQLAAQPVLVFGHELAQTKDYTAALYFYPIGSLLHVLLAWMIARYLFPAKQTNKKRQGMKGFVVGLLLLLLTLPNIWLASCCGDVPGWPLDVALRQYVFAAGGDPVARLEFYETVLPFLFPLQLIIGATGAGLLYRRSLA